MAQATQALLEAQVGADREAPTIAIGASAGTAGADVRLSVHKDLAPLEREWTTFQQHADCTVFQTFEWLATWQQHIGAPNHVVPAVVIGRAHNGEMLFLLPLAVETHWGVCRLGWLGSELCDYNAPLLTRDFSQRLGAGRFAPLWHDILRRLQDDASLRHDLIDLKKMPEAVGGQANPFLQLSVGLHPSGAYLAHLASDWKTFYEAKRSSSTRRRDRTKLKRLSDFGTIRFVHTDGGEDTASTLDTFFRQKARLFATMGVGNIFADPACREFFRALATSPATRHLTHVSRLEVGATPAAVNLGLIFHGRYYHVLASYDDGDLSRFGPGRAHLHEMLQYAIERGLTEFDFTIGDEPYKRDWSDTELKLYDHLSAVTPRGAMMVSMMAAYRRSKRFIKQTPALWQLFSNARSLAASLRLR